MVKILIPQPLRKYSSDNSEINIEAKSVGEALDKVAVRYPALGEKLKDGSGIKNFVSIFLNKEDIRAIDGMTTPVEEDDEIMVIPAIAGG